MNKKAQGLPMQTIILIIIVLLVLSAVGIFFFTQFATGQTGTKGGQCIQLCQTIRAQMASNKSVFWDPSDGPMYEFKQNCCDVIDCQVRHTQYEDSSYSDAC